ncbi:Bacterial transferase hexapeptide repeat protein [Agrobacterium fabacearum CFBP 5771]|uniref:CatB-related O-acetyltransferase n=1 Tax=Agrobacterium tumefaciens TaxID=358 RepID=UPI0009BBACBB|nr:CatB-related O-acetyltransferase [Agrobacterium tumefaciens]CVI22747.1 Bacterial transferase hexapeptide repeat protein [Agrobacterium fabacearum CFBP 5771]
MASTIPKTSLVSDGCQYEDPIHVGPQCTVLATKIGRYAFINSGTSIFDNVEVGRFCTFARNCQIGGTEHPIHYLSTSFFRISRNWFPNDEIAQTAPLVKNSPPEGRSRSSKILIGSDVWFGAGAIVLKGLTIGHGAVIGAGAVVTKDVPPYAIVAGNPAKVIRFRFEKPIIDRLLASPWWDRDPGWLATVPLNDVEASLRMLEAAS